MNDALKQSARNLLAVTIAFAVGGAVITAILYGLYVFGVSLELGRGVENWYQVGVLTVGLSALAGLIIDVLRLAAALVWRTEPEQRHSFREIVRQSLA